MDADLGIIALGPVRETALPIRILFLGGGGGEQAEIIQREINPMIAILKNVFFFIVYLTFKD
jgi:hypothetical protein